MMRRATMDWRREAASAYLIMAKALEDREQAKKDI